MPYNTSVIRRAEQILGYGITNTTGERTFPVIDGVVYTDLFTGIPTIPDYTGTIVRKFNGRRNNLVYWNELYLENCNLEEVTLNLAWGSDDFDTDIDGLLLWLSENDTSSSLDEAGVKSKKIEDFSVTKGSAEETVADINIILNEGYRYYIRRPIILDVSSEHRYDYRHF